MGDVTGEAWERQRRSFERTAQAYDRYRPSYPAALFDDVRTYADLAPDDRILEIGCGTGRATLPIAAWGNPVVALEPAREMADVARTHLDPHPNVEVVTARFEDDGAYLAGSFGLVVCAQAFHWLDPQTRAARIRDALYHFGTAAILSNVQVSPREERAFFERAQDVYLAVAPELAHQGDFRSPGDLPPHPLEGAPGFVDLKRRVHRWQWTLPTERYVSLLGTHSGHAALDPRVRERLHTAIAELIDDAFEGRVTEHYESAAWLARRA